MTPSKVDLELVEALRDAEPDELEAIIASLPADSIEPLLGMLGAAAEEDMPPTPAAQAVELDPGYLIRPHIDLLSEKLAEAVADVERGISRKLIVSMPPRHGKTELASVYLPLWLLRRDGALVEMGLGRFGNAPVHGHDDEGR